MEKKRRHIPKNFIHGLVCGGLLIVLAASSGICGGAKQDVQNVYTAPELEPAVMDAADVAEETTGQDVWKGEESVIAADGGDWDNGAGEPAVAGEEIRTDITKTENVNHASQTETGTENRGQALSSGPGQANGVIADTLPAKSLANDRANANYPESNKLTPYSKEPDASGELDHPQDPGASGGLEGMPEPGRPQFPDVPKDLQDTEINPVTGMYYRYDSRERGVITPVKDQGGYNTCWAFAAAAAAEASVLSKQAQEGTPDFSELQLAYFFYHSVPDKLGNTAGDGTMALGGLDYLDRGGNEIFATFSLANRTGFTEEERLPYGQAHTDSGLEVGDALFGETLAWEQDTYFLENAYWIAYKDTAVMKQAVIDYGAAAFQFYSSHSILYYNEKTYGYYCDTVKPVNHAAVIVGWDDTYSRKNFTKDPGMDGAWLVKNSYGTGLGDQGYIWVSYADKAFTSDVYKAYVFDVGKADQSTLYQYDGSNGYLYSDVKSGTMAANVFHAQAPGASGSEFLTKVSFALYDTYVNYDVQIYRLDEEAFENGIVVDPLAGQPCIDEAHKVSGQTTVTGYYTVQLDVPVELKPGETFSVVVTFSKNDGSDIGLFVDGSYQNGSWIRFVNEVHAGESFLYEEGAWNDLADDTVMDSIQPGLTVRLKAVTMPQETKA